MVSQTNALIACAALYFATAGTFAYITFYNICIFFLITRAHYINLIFKELQFTESLGEEFSILSSDHTIFSKELPNNAEYRQFHQKTSKWSLFGKFNGTKVKEGNTMPWTFQEIADKATQATFNKLWSTKKRDESENFSEMYNIQNLMKTSNLSDFKLIFRMRVPFSLSLSFWKIENFDNIYRFINELTFTKESTPDYIIHKLNHLSITLNNVLECIEILNVEFTKFITCSMFITLIPIVFYSFGKLRYFLKYCIYSYFILG